MNSRRLTILARWAGVAPGAALAGGLTWLALQAFARGTLWAADLDPATAVGHLYVETLSGLPAGAVFVYAGVKIAPAWKKRVAYALGAAAVFGAGFVLFPALGAADYWRAWNAAAALVGAAVVTFAAGDGEAPAGAVARRG